MTKFSTVTQVAKKRVSKESVTPTSGQTGPQGYADFLGPLAVPKQFDPERRNLV